ncbi:MAG: hypothetical protein LBI57_07070 [Helicobacteraceae bacterium]|jgi:alpha-tubulin suppressor-like RCC1 family protein|nr:hypothetical protein [Helicobacteraceae bacterium]
MVREKLFLFSIFIFYLTLIGCAVKNGEIASYQKNDVVVLERDANRDDGASITESNASANPPETTIKATIGVIKRFAIGSKRIVALDRNGRLWTAGDNGKERLGGEKSPSSFARADGLDGATIADAFVGYDSTFAIDSEGGVWASGNNAYGQLGLGDSNDKTTFFKVESLSGVRVTAIASGRQHTIALDSEGDVWVVGGNSLGQLGLGDLDARSLFVKVKAPRKIKAIAAGCYHSIALDSEGDVWVSGANAYGQLGVNYGGEGAIADQFTQTKIGDGKIIAVAAGANHSIALDSEGDVWVSGRNRSGQLGLGDSADRYVFEKYPASVKFAAIAASEDYSLALDRVGAVWASGDNGNDRLGFSNGGGYVGAFAKSSGAIVAIVAGENHTIFIDDNGGAKVNGVASAYLSAAISEVKTFSVDTGDLQYLYDRGFEKICDKTATKPNISDYAIVSVAAGDSHAIALDENGRLLSSGHNEYGQLGLGDIDNRNGFAAIAAPKGRKIAAIAVGAYHSFAIDSEGGVWTSGFNGYNQLGLDDAGNRAVFVEQTDLSGKRIVAIAAGAHHTFALDDNGGVWASGRNNRGQLGFDDAYDRATFSEAQSLSGKTIVKIAAGAYHSLALDDNGGVWASGANDDGQLGLGGDADRARFTEVKSLSGKTIVAIAAGENFSLALDSNGAVWASGANDDGQLGLGSNKTKQTTFTRVTSLSGAFITAIAVGDRHALALDGDGKIYATGLNDAGQLGLGDQNDRLSFIAPRKFGGGAVVAIAAGEKHSILLSGGGRIWASGQNYYGQLGLDDNVNRNEFASLEPTGCAKKFGNSF